MTTNAGMQAMMQIALREWKRLLRQPSRVVASVATPVMLWVFLAGGLSGAMRTGESQDGNYALYLLPGVIAMTLMFSSIFAAISLIEDRNEGVLRVLLCAPVPTWAIVAGKIVGCSSIALAQALLVIPAAWVMGAHPGTSDILVSIGVMVLLSAGLTGLCLALAWRVNSSSGFHGVMNAILMPMWFLSSAVFPLTTSSTWLKVAMYANPMTWPTVALRHSLVGWNMPVSAGVVWIATIVFGIAGAVFGWVVLSVGRRRGSAT
ncbi:MAG: ABC transporter permease [Phycisphaeraceae bacterium]|nr:ABC transporter permease [Phycisphaerales bacterium]MCB9860627.1 ABC transporter permease [Phycisphaeraceae bacterium]